MFRLHLKRIPDVFLDLEVLNPEKIDGMNSSELKNLPIRQGNSEIPLSEFFEIEEIEGDALIIIGDLSRTRNLGFKMRKGKIIVEGDAGMHVGCQMKGGEIVIRGNADSWIGCEMRGGKIEISGRAGDYVGSAYRGSEKGMMGGEIKIGGSAGNFIGEFMSGGVIEISSDTGVHAGSNMTGGEIKIGGTAILPGGGMRGGVIRVERIVDMLPTFKFEGEEDGYSVFSGDYAVNGKGRIYARELR